MKIPKTLLKGPARFRTIRRTITLLLLLFSALARAQDNSLVSFIGEKQGFSESTVYSILKDHLGFMWFGCSDGLWRFDGYNFKKYAHEPGNANSLSGSFVTNVFEDSKGNLWVGTLNAGLNKFNPANTTFSQYTHIEQDSSSIFKNYISEIAEDAEGNIWFCATKLHRLDPTTDKITRFDAPEVNQLTLSSICPDADGSIWVGSSGDGIFRFEPKTKKFTPYNYNFGDETIRIRSKVIRRIIDDGHGNLWIGSYGGLIRLEKKSGKTTAWMHEDENTNSISHNSIWDLAVDGDQLFIATWGGGFNIFNITQNSFENSLFKPGGIYGINSMEVPSLYFDRGRFWLGTNGDGIYHFKTPSGLTLMKSQEVFLGKDIHEVFSKKRFTYFTGVEGLMAYTDKQGVVFTLPPASDKKANSLSGNRISSVSEDQRGNVFIGTEEGITQYQIESGKVIYHRNDPKDSTTLRHNSVLSLYCDSNDDLWVGTPFGLDILHAKGKGFVHVRKSRVKVTQVLAIEESPEGMWIGSTTNGLSFLSRDGKSDQWYQYDESKRDGIGSNYISNLLYMPGVLWLGTRDGLQKLDVDHKTFEKIPLPKELMGQSVNSWSASTLKNRFYLAANNRLAIVDPERQPSVKMISIYSNEENKKTIWSPGENRLYFFAKNNVAYISGDSTGGSSIQPHLVITDFQLDYNNKHPLDSIRQRESPTYWKEIVLDYDQNLFSIEFASLDYAKPGENQYAYRLVGFDGDWTYSGSRRFATYTNLSPGTYTFRVKGSNNDGIWNEAGTSLIIKILPPPWKTWWAYMVYVLLFIWLLWLGRRAVIHRERLQAQVLIEKNVNKTLQELDLLKTRFFSNITHEFRTPLTLIQGSADEMLGKVKDPQEVQFMRMIRSNSDRLLKLINQMLDLARFDAKEMKLKNKEIALREFLRRSVSQFSSMAESKGIRFEWNVPDHLPDVIADDEKLEVVFTNLISNAIKFTKRDGEVNVSVDLRERNLIFIIRDTGRGIPSENLKHIFNRFYQVSPTDSSHSEGTGIGLALVKEYVELMQGEIQVESVVGSGTTFHVKLPLEITDAIKTNSPQEVLTQSISLSGKTENGSAPIILIVEDNEDIRNFIRICLGKEFHFEEARNGKEGFEMAMKLVPDIIISDLMMPEMDGIELCHAIKHDGRTDHIPFIMLTAKATEEDKIEGLQTGADDYLVKPFNKTELALKVRHLILLREKLQVKLRAELLTQASPVEAVSASELFLVNVRNFIEKNLNNEDLSVEMLASALGMSREQCYRKITALTSLSPSALIRKLRLQKAAQLLANQWGPVSQVAYEVGFGNLSHFSKSFKEEFGQLPSEYVNP